jgi:uncharacterized FlgJ-related protein
VQVQILSPPRVRLTKTKTMRKCLLTVILILISAFTYCENQQDPIDLKTEIKSYINCVGIEYPDIVFAQALLESGNMKSKMFVKYNNLFGMKFPNKRKTTAIFRLKNGYAVYNNWGDCVEDYYLFQQSLFERKHYNKNEYLSMLNKTYSKSGQYSKKIRRIIERNKNVM